MGMQIGKKNANGVYKIRSLDNGIPNFTANKRKMQSNKSKKVVGQL